MAKIVAITIGPIVETISESRKIYEIANALAFFSTFMYEFLKKIQESKKYEIVTPYFDNNESKLYPDRAVLRLKLENLEDEKVVEEIEIFKEEAFKKFLEKISSMEKSDNIKNLEKINEIIKGKENKNYKNNYEVQMDLLKEYINFNIVIMNTEKNEEIKEIFSKLDGIELIKTFPIKYNEKEINQIIEKSLLEKVKLTEDKFLVDEKNYRAIISLDLDNMGKFSQDKIEEIKEVSKAIYNYVSGLEKFIKEKKDKNKTKNEGLVLYSAGDDILAILNPKYVFEFIEKACSLLEECFGKLKNNELTVSFGIFICYDKNPIKESIEKSHELLFYNAKTLNRRNSAVISVQKHSGQSFEFIMNDLVKDLKFNKKNIFFEKINSHLKKYMNENTRDEKTHELKNEKERLLNTIIQKVYRDSFVFREIIKNPNQIDNYLNNLFESDFKNKELLKDLRELLNEIGREFSEIENKVEREKNKKFEKLLEKVVSYFKLVKFYEDRGKR